MLVVSFCMCCLQTSWSLHSICISWVYRPLAACCYLSVVYALWKLSSRDIVFKLTVRIPAYFEHGMHENYDNFHCTFIDWMTQHVPRNSLAVSPIVFFSSVFDCPIMPVGRWLLTYSTQQELASLPGPTWKIGKRVCMVPLGTCVHIVT